MGDMLNHTLIKIQNLMTSVKKFSPNALNMDVPISHVCLCGLLLIMTIQLINNLWTTYLNLTVTI